MTARLFIGFRVSKTALDWIDQRAKEEDVSRSEMIRIMLKHATLKMPKGWR